MNHPTIVTLALALGLAMPATQRAAPPPPATDFGHEIFYAVLEGLYQDGLRNETVDLVLQKSEEGLWAHFVPGCPVCIYVLEAFRHYRARPDFVSFKQLAGGSNNTWGRGLSDEHRARFASDEMKTRLAALHDLVERWLDRRMERLRLDEQERAAWRGELEQRSKKGMSILTAEREAGRMQPWGELRCPSCDGAVDAATGR